MSVAAIDPHIMGPFTLAQFMTFLVERRDSERWELIDGAAVMMNPPTHRHKIIAKTLERLFDAALAVRRPELEALREAAIVLPGGEPNEKGSWRVTDVSIVDKEDSEESFERHHYVVVEIHSKGNSKKAVADKLEATKAHASAEYFIFIRQDRRFVQIYRKSDGWAEPSTLTDLNDMLTLPDFGFACTLAELYAGTALAEN